MPSPKAINQEAGWAEKCQFGGTSQVKLSEKCLMIIGPIFRPIQNDVCWSLSNGPKNKVFPYWNGGIFSRLSSVAPRPATGWRRAQGWSDWASPKNDGKGNGNSQTWQWTSHVWRFGAVGMSMARLDTWVRGYTNHVCYPLKILNSHLPQISISKKKNPSALVIPCFFPLFFRSQTMMERLEEMGWSNPLGSLVFFTLWSTFT